MYVCHAELNAILNSAHNNLKGARVYVTLFPCNECTKAIIQSGIAEVVYYHDKFHGAVHVQKGDSSSPPDGAVFHSMFFCVGLHKKGRREADHAYQLQLGREGRD